MKYIIFIIYFFLFTKNSLSTENFYDINYLKSDLKYISKEWEYHSGVFKDTQNKIKQYKDKLIHLDGNKNLIVLSLKNGKEICKNIGEKDRAPFRGVSIYKSKENVYAIFARHGILKKINIENCKEFKFEKKIIIKNLSTSVLIHNKLGIVLPNGGLPSAYNLDTGELIWEVWIDKKIKNKLKKYNLDKKFNWDVWGGGTLDLKYNQVIFSTANAKPSFVSKNRKGPNLFYNSVVAINLDTGKYNWHFQEIEHDVLNLDLASKPVVYDSINEDIVIQASKSGQLILLDRKTGLPLEKFKEKIYYHDKKKKFFTKFKEFDDWLQFSKRHFNKNDINELTENYKKEALKIIEKSIIADYKILEKNKNYIHYGMHGGSEWPGIGVDKKGNIIIPANNIAWMSKLNNPKEFKFRIYFKEILVSIFNLFTFDFIKFKQNAKNIIKNFKKIIYFNKLDIEKYKRFEAKDGVPLNSPPWGTVTLISLKDKEIKWTRPHGRYKQIKESNSETGSEVFGCPVIVGEVFFISGTRDKIIYAYDIKNGKILWKDQLPFISYGCPIIANNGNDNYLIIDSSGGRKFTDQEYGDAIVAYKLK